MRKITKLAAVLCAVTMAAAMGFTSLADNSEDGSVLDESLGLIRMEGTVISMEEGRLTLNRRLGDGMQEIVVYLREDAKILDGVNGYPIPGENLEKGETVQVYVGQAMTMSLPPIVNGEMVIADVPADAGFPSYTTVKSLTKGQSGEYILETSDGDSYTVNTVTELLPYLTRNIVTVEDLTPGRKILLWTENANHGAAAKIVMFAEEFGNTEDFQELSGWQETDDGWYFYENGEMKTGWLLDNGDWYYLSPETGLMKTGFVTLSGKTYFLQEDGRMLTKAAVFEPDENGELHIRK